MFNVPGTSFDATSLRKVRTMKMSAWFGSVFK
jgi:hypothetical protein